jgi:hypothetical protein
MDIPSKYEPGKAEDKWYSYWMKQGFFRSIPDEREPYTYVIPPPKSQESFIWGTCLTIQYRMSHTKGQNAGEKCMLDSRNRSCVDSH